MVIRHKIAVFLSKFRERPLVRRSSIVYAGVTLPQTCIVGERVKLKGVFGRFPSFGEHCFINDDVVVLGDVQIGKCSRLNHKCFIQDCDHDEDDFPQPDNTPKNLDTTVSPVIIGKNVTIDTMACVCKGVTIGDGAIIGVGAVVRDNVPEDAYVIGNPAHVVGYRKKRATFSKRQGKA